ncbi:MAG: response regulator transcription factor [Rhodoferax sp.]|nr:response regulator transcription factor [Rhodoferax sp.]
MKLARLVLADDHALVRAGLRNLLALVPGIEVVGEAEDGRRVLLLAEQLQPDLVLMDLSMPGLTGLEATARLRKTWPKIKVLVLSMYQNEEHVRQAMRNGAHGYLLKDAAPEELELAIHAVLSGQTYLSSAIAATVILSQAAAPGTQDDRTTQLTPRQLEVLRLVAQGLSSKDIARRLAVSVKTVDSHRSGLMKQLDIHEVTGLVRYAIHTGLIQAGL